LDVCGPRRVAIESLCADLGAQAFELERIARGQSDLHAVAGKEAGDRSAEPRPRTDDERTPEFGCRHGVLVDELNRSYGINTLTGAPHARASPPAARPISPRVSSRRSSASSGARRSSWITVPARAA